MNGPDRSEYSTSTNSLELLKSSLANMSHMPYFVNPLERYHFMDGDLVEDQKQVLGITEDILCNPLDLTMCFASDTATAHAALS